MADPALGVRRRCMACGAAFYDLSRKPINCPKCAAVFVPEPPRRSSAAARGRARLVPVPAPKPEAEEIEAEDASTLLESDDDDEPVADDVGVDETSVDEIGVEKP